MDENSQPEVTVEGRWFSMKAEDIAKEWVKGSLPAIVRLQKAVLQIAEESILLEESSRATWRHEKGR